MIALPRVIPVLLQSEGYLVKPLRFGKAQYIGDPINAVKIFNEKQVDELVICDIDASPRGTGIDFGLIEEIVSEKFMPVGYGGGIATVDDAKRIISIGIEKVILNTVIHQSPEVVVEISKTLGSSSTVASVDARRKITGSYEACFLRGSRKSGMNPVKVALEAESLGAGEILVSAIDKESTFSGYDLPLIRSVSEAVSVPVIALGGASSVADFSDALDAGASAIVAGSMFVLNGKHRAVLITYPTPAEIQALASR